MPGFSFVRCRMQQVIRQILGEFAKQSEKSEADALEFALMALEYVLQEVRMQPNGVQFGLVLGFPMADIGTWGIATELKFVPIDLNELRVVGGAFAPRPQEYQVAMTAQTRGILKRLVTDDMPDYVIIAQALFLARLIVRGELVFQNPHGAYCPVLLPGPDVP